MAARQLCCAKATGVVCRPKHTAPVMSLNRLPGLRSVEHREVKVRLMEIKPEGERKIEGRSIERSDKKRRMLQ